ncbi:MAG TPA: TIGR02301 family protein [Xanthobacteraceae bacterium]|nr:TIGR02301 family protein [Xanthobacteraceae bacterium]
MASRVLAPFCLLLAFAGTPSYAVESVKPPPASVAGGAAPYDGELQRLSEILGTLHYLRGLCGAQDADRWRDQVQALLDAETAPGERRARIVASFNRGYRNFQQTYRTCTPAADFAIRRYLEEGAKISREITARYAN